nr:cation:proton antiporter [Polyangium aurulentum]
MLEALTHNPLTLLILQMMVVISLSRLLGAGIRRIGQPMVIAEVTAGILLGPSLLGWLAPNVMTAIFPKTSMSLLSMLSQVGLVLFMFLIGLELDPKLLQNRGRTSIVISQSGIMVPFALGALAASFLRDHLAEPDVPASSFTLFMGIAMSITAFPVLARILTEKRLLKSKAGAMAITCAAVDDVMGWCLLAFVVSVVRSTGMASAVTTTLLAVGYIAAMLFVVRPFLARLAARVSTSGPIDQTTVAVTLLLLLLSSMVTELIGIHALFGAFAFGAAIPKEGGFAQALAEKLEDVVVVLLLPLFFAYSGLRTQIGLLNSPHHWAICALIIVLACAGKFGGSAVAARLTGINWRESTAIGILMNTRGLMELIVLNIGLDLGVISPTLFTMMVIMALFTTFITSPLLARVYPAELFAKELDGSPEATPMPAVGVPAFTTLMCVDDERTGPGMVTLGRALSGEGQGADKLYALHLIKPADRASFHLSQERQSTPDDDRALAPLLERAKALAASVKPLSFVSDKPGADICRVAEAKHADLLLLGWRKPLISQSALSGTVYQVMHRAPADVGVLVDRGLTGIRRVLVPFIGGGHDRAALRLAHRLMHQAGASVTLLHVTTPGKKESSGAKARMEEVFQEPGAEGRVTFKVTEHDVPSEAAIAEAAQGGYDLVVVGAAAEWGLAERMFGLHSERMIRACPISLLVVHERGAAAAPAREPARATAPLEPARQS